MPRKHVAFAVTGLCSIVASAAGQELIREHLGPASGGSFGNAVTALSDLDGDGAREYAVGDNGAGVHAGTVDVFSGATGTIRFTIQGSGSGTFGDLIRDAGDMDGDGVSDLLVGDRLFDDPNQPYLFEGAVHIHSGADGSLIKEFIGTTDYNDFGAAVDGLDDIDGDAIPDVLVLTNIDPGDTNEHRASAVSGSDGHELYSVVMDGEDDARAICVGVDRDGDGFRDFLVAAYSPCHCSDGGSEGLLRAVSGAAGATLLEMTIIHPSFSLAEVGDLDGDGKPDVLAGYSYYNGGGGGGGFTGGANNSELWVYSVASGTTLRGNSDACFSDSLGDVDGDGVDDYVISGGARASAVVVSGRSGETLYAVARDVTGPSAGLGDVNGDRNPDFIVGAPGFIDSSGVQRGRARIYAGNDFWLNASAKAVVQDDEEALIARGVPVGHLIGVAVVELSGTPMFQFLAIGAADATEALVLEGTVPPGLWGLTATFQSFAIGRTGRVVGSARETVAFL